MPQSCPLTIGDVMTSWKTSDKLFLEGKHLHSFIVLYQLLYDSTNTDLSSSLSPSFPSYLKREELLTRIRAVEILLLPSRSSKQAMTVVENKMAAMQKLELAQAILMPVFHGNGYISASYHRSDRCINRLVSSFGKMDDSEKGSLQYNDYFLNSSIVRPITIDLDNSTQTSPSSREDAVVEQNLALHKYLESLAHKSTFPVALVVRVHILQALLLRRAQQFKKSLLYLQAAHTWVKDTFQTHLDALRNLVGNPTNSAVFDELLSQLEVERDSCEALVSLEDCRIFFSQINNTSSLVNSSKVEHLQQKYQEYLKALEYLSRRSQKYNSWVLSFLRQEKRRELNQPLLIRYNPWCLCAGKMNKDTPLVYQFDGLSVSEALGYYHCIARILKLQAIRPRSTLENSLVVQKAFEGIKFHLEICAFYFSPIGKESGSVFSLLKRLFCLSFAHNVTGELPLLRSPLVVESDHAWVTPGLMKAVDLYTEMCTMIASPTFVIATHKQEKESLVEQICHRVYTKKQEILELIEREMLSISSATPASSMRVPTPRFDLSSYAHTRFLVVLKCCTWISAISFYISQLECRTAIKQAYQLVSFVAAFQKHTRELLPHIHTLMACLAMLVSFRTAPLPELPNDPIRNRMLAKQNNSGNSEKESTELDNVGLIYMHLAETERFLQIHSFQQAPSFFIYIRLLKAMSLWQASYNGVRVVVNNARCSVEPLTPPQRQQCLESLDKILERLTESFETVQANERADGFYKPPNESEATPNVLNEGRSENPHGGSFSILGWSPRNRVLFLLIKGIFLLHEEHDELTAMTYFEAAIRLAEDHFGMASSFIADGVQLLAASYKTFYGMLKTYHHQWARLFFIALQIASQTNRTALFFCEQQQMSTEMSCQSLSTNRKRSRSESNESNKGSASHFWDRETANIGDRKEGCVNLLEQLYIIQSKVFSLSPE